MIIIQLVHFIFTKITNSLPKIIINKNKFTQNQKKFYLANE